ncbi:MAG: putative DNA-binding domain-containing protein [Acidithiobacillales bacterium]
MSATALSLAATQDWMQAVLVHPEGAGKGLSAPGARRHLAPENVSRIVKGRGTLDAAERLEIYAGMYPLRMVEALRSDYPALAGLLGAKGFERLVTDYVAAHPSESFTLARLGDRLPEFMAGWGTPHRRGLLADVARLELAATQVFDAETTALIDLSAMETVSALEWRRMKVVPAAAFRLVSVRPGAVDVLDAFLDGRRRPSSSGRGRVQVAYYRRDFVVLRRTLGPFDGSLLASICTGQTLGAALERAGRTFPRGFPSPEILSGWFSEWSRLGFFAGIELWPCREGDYRGAAGRTGASPRAKRRTRIPSRESAPAPKAAR